MKVLWYVAATDSLGREARTVVEADSKVEALEKGKRYFAGKTRWILRRKHGPPITLAVKFHNYRVGRRFVSPPDVKLARMQAAEGR